MLKQTNLQCYNATIWNWTWPTNIQKHINTFLILNSLRMYRRKREIINSWNAFHAHSPCQGDNWMNKYYCAFKREFSFNSTFVVYCNVTIKILKSHYHVENNYQFISLAEIYHYTYVYIFINNKLNESLSCCFLLKMVD